MSKEQAMALVDEVFACMSNKSRWTEEKIRMDLLEYFEYADYRASVFFVKGKYVGGAYADVVHSLSSKYYRKINILIERNEDRYNDEYCFYGNKEYCLLLQKHLGGHIVSQCNNLYSISVPFVIKRKKLSADDFFYLFETLKNES